MRFQLARYAEALRGSSLASADRYPEEFEEALAATRLQVIGRVAPRQAFLHDIAYLLSCGLLDARFDTLLIPVLAPANVDLAAWLESQDFGLESGFWRSRLADGACVVLINDARAAWIESTVQMWPRCRFIVGSAEETALPGFHRVRARSPVTSRPTSS